MEVTQVMIDGWKATYKKVYMVSVGGQDWYFKRLSREDYFSIAESTNVVKGFDSELETVTKCLLGEYNLADLTGASGVVSKLSEQILLRSGFEDVESQEL